MKILKSFLIVPELLLDLEIAQLRDLKSPRFKTFESLKFTEARIRNFDDFETKEFCSDVPKFRKLQSFEGEVKF